MSNISKLTWTAVATEAAPGTAEAAPTMYIPCTSKFQNKTKYVYSNEERGTRDTNNVRTGTTRMSTGSLQGDVYLASIGYPLLSFMGTDTPTQPDVTNAPTAHQHAFSLADTGKAMTFFKGYDHSGYFWAYSVVDKLKFKFSADGKLLEWEGSTQSQYKEKVAGGAYTAMNAPTYHADDYAALAGYAPTLTVGISQSQDIEEMEIELSQKVTLYYSSRGNRGFYKVDYGDREAHISFTARFEDTSWDDKEVNDTREALNIQFQGALIGTAPSTTHYEFSLNFPIIAYDEIEVDTSGEAIKVKAKCTAMPGTTKNSLFTGKVINTVTSYAA